MCCIFAPSRSIAASARGGKEEFLRPFCRYGGCFFFLFALGMVRFFQVGFSVFLFLQRLKGE